MTINYAERLLLLQALIVRRVPAASRITPILLMEALQADNALVKEETPHLYFNDHLKNLSQEVAACVDAGLIEDGTPKKVKNRWTTAPVCKSYRRTPLGDQYLTSMESRLEELLDSMPMSDVGILDFLSLL